MPLWQTLAGGGITILATAVTQTAIGRRDRKARAIAREQELANLKDEREHAARVEIRSRSREAAERALGLAVSLRDTGDSAKGTDDPFFSYTGSTLQELATAALLIEDKVVRSALNTARSTIFIWSAQVVLEDLSPVDVRKHQMRVIRTVVELLSAYLRADDESLQQHLTNLSGTHTVTLTAQRELRIAREAKEEAESESDETPS